MIRWLEDERLSSAVKANMARFKATSFAKDLDEGDARWRFMSWPRTDHNPMRFLLESDDRRHATFTFDAAGMAYGKIEHAEEGVTTGRSA
jgi:hypothetical protein